MTQINVSEILPNDTYQARLDPDLPRRSREIFKSVQDSGSTQYRDPLIVARCKGGYILLDGAGRLAACREYLKWPKVNVAIVQGGHRVFTQIAALANSSQVAQRALSRRDKELNCFRLKQANFSLTEIAKMMGLALSSVRSYISRGGVHTDNLVKRHKLTRPGCFTSPAEAKAACLKLFSQLLTADETRDEMPKRWQTMQGYIFQHYGTLVSCMRADDNEIKKVAFDFQLAKMQGRQHRSLVLLYHTSDKATTESQKCVEYFREWYGEAFESVTLTVNLERVARDKILTFLDAGVPIPFTSISIGDSK
jgi:DNA-binding CsgD family transcriptional regulator